MIAVAKAWLLQYGLVLALVAGGLGWAAAGVQTVRLARLETSTAKAAKAAADQALVEYEAMAGKYSMASKELVKAQGERDAARRKTGAKVIEYITRSGADAQCLDVDGLRLITDLGRGTATDPAGAAGAVPDGASVAQ